MIWLVSYYNNNLTITNIINVRYSLVGRRIEKNNLPDEAWSDNIQLVDFLKREGCDDD